MLTSLTKYNIKTYKLRFINFKLINNKFCLLQKYYFVLLI